MPHIVSFAALGISPADFGRRALRWAAGFSHCFYQESNDLAYPQGAFRRLLAVAHSEAGPTSLADLRPWLQQNQGNGPVCGFLTYDLKNEIEDLSSRNYNGFAWPQLHFFRPQTWLSWQTDFVEIHGRAARVLAQILAATPPVAAAPPAVPPLRPRLPKADYLQAVEAIREDILNGEVYELNLCQEFYAEGVALDPLEIFWRLQAASPAPFAGFCRHHAHYLLCASPERFLAHRPPLLFSQPIKGTIGRGPTPAADEQQRQALLHDEKERAENLMIVDLVRNDLARVAQTGTVAVPELFGLYPFRYVWQMISTVQARLRPGVELEEILRATFPMGSMTGAPKIWAMQLIEHYERSQRGLYSGSLGCVWPDQSFDFNVVIRSLQYRADTGYLAFQVGSAITYDSDPAREYEECLLKAKALLEALRTTIEG